MKLNICLDLYAYPKDIKNVDKQLNVVYGDIVETYY